MHVAIAICVGPVCEFKRSVVTNVEPDKIRGTELDDTQLWNVCVASTTIRIYALLLHIHSPHWGGGVSTSSRKAAEMFRLKLESCSWLSQCWEMVCFPNGPIPGDQCVPSPPMQIPAYMLHCFGVRTLDHLNGKRHHTNPGHFFLLSMQSNQRILSQISNLLYMLNCIYILIPYLIISTR